jgi:hypothetical protein
VGPLWGRDGSSSLTSMELRDLLEPGAYQEAMAALGLEAVLDL